MFYSLPFYNRRVVMKRIALLLMAIFLGCMVPSSAMVRDSTPLENVFNSKEFVLKEVDINGWVRLSEIQVSPGFLDQISACAFNDMSSILKIDGIVTLYDEKGIAKKGENSENGLSIEVTAGYSEKDEKYDAVVSVNITQHACMKNITDIRRELFNCLCKYGSNPYVNICITKYIDGDIGLEKMQVLLEKELSALDAEKVESMYGDNMISISGYSGNLPWFIKCGGKYININAACRYNTYEDKTYFWLGTPVIASEY